MFTRIWLALFGLWSWDDLPALPPEVILLPRWAPLNIYDFACWARQTIVPLTVVAAHRPVRAAAVRARRAAHRRRAPAGGARPRVTGRAAVQRLDRVLHRYERRPIATAAARGACARAERWIVARQEADGCWGGIQPPWVYSMIALHLLGYPLDHPVMRARPSPGSTRFSRPRGRRRRRLEACQSPVWDTALAVVALRRRRRRPRPTRRS